MKLVKELSKLFRLSCCSNLVKFTQSRYSSYDSSPFLVDLGKVTVKYEVAKSPKEWKFVENVLPPILVPTPIPKKNYPSDWKPQAENISYLPYYIPRTKNHMIPVYLLICRQGMRRITIVKKIQGDIWHLERDIRQFLEPQQIKPIRSQVNELAGFIRFHGDHVNAIKYWLMKINL